MLMPSGDVAEPFVRFRLYGTIVVSSWPYIDVTIGDRGGSSH